MVRIVVDTNAPLNDLDTILVEALEAQHRRLLDKAAATSDADWTSPTRCDDWDLRQLFLHLRWGRAGTGLRLTGSTPDPGVVDDIGEGFDPRETPKGYVDGATSESPAEVTSGFEARSREAIDAVRATIDAGTDLQVAAVWGAPVDFRVLTTHLFWDSIIHELDYGDALGSVSDDHLRLALAYGALMGSFILAISGGSGTMSYAVSNPSASVLIHVADGQIRVEVADDGEGPELRGVVDALAGRGDTAPSALLVTDEHFSSAMDSFAGVLRGAE